MARVRGGLSVNDFVKLITVQQYSARALRTLGPAAILLAEAEGLPATPNPSAPLAKEEGQ